MNDSACVKAMQWFREDVRFSRDYTDIPDQLITYSEDPLMLKAISNYAKAADLGIEDVQFDVNNREIDNNNSAFPENMPDELKMHYHNLHKRWHPVRISKCSKCE